MIFPPTLLDRLIASDAAYTSARLGVIAAREQNPFGAAVRHDGDLHAFRCAGIPSPSFNRIIGFSDARVDAVADLTDWLRAAGPRGCVEMLPHRHGPKLAAALAANRWKQAEFESLLGARPCAEAPPTPVAIESVESAAAMDVFLDTHLEGWGIDPRYRDGAKANMRNWLGLPGWTMLLARVDGAPAGSAVLHMADGVAYCADAATPPAWRGRGVQTTLLRRRLCLAAAAGCEIVWSRSSIFSTSESNMLRAGFFRLCNVAVWRQIAP